MTTETETTTTVVTIADAPAIRRSFADLSDCDPNLVRSLTEAQTALRAACEYAREVDARNRATAGRLVALTQEIADAPGDRIGQLRAERHGLQSDFAFAVDDVEVAAKREITATLAWADVAVELLTTRPRLVALHVARADLDAARAAISNPNAHLDQAGTGAAMRRGADAIARIEAARNAEGDELAIITIDAAITELLWPVKPSVRPDAWRLSRQKSDRLVPELVAHRRATAADKLAGTGG